MSLEQRYAAIINQAFSPELVDLTAGDPGFPEIAETLSSDLYLLSIEFGVEFNKFKARVMQEVLDRPRLKQGDGKSDPSGSRISLLGPAMGNLPILVFALELMRDDAEFETE
ncbi:MAG: hypothetical protein ACI97A_003271 [Planctomycetota bacterium]|jgi:hypothetical protein